MLEEFSKQVDSINWPSGNPETINYKALDIHLAKYQVRFDSGDVSPLTLLSVSHINDPIVLKGHLVLCNKQTK